RSPRACWTARGFPCGWWKGPAYATSSSTARPNPRPLLPLLEEQHFRTDRTVAGGQERPHGSGVPRRDLGEQGLTVRDQRRGGPGHGFPESLPAVLGRDFDCDLPSTGKASAERHHRTSSRIRVAPKVRP